MNYRGGSALAALVIAASACVRGEGAPSEELRAACAELEDVFIQVDNDQAGLPAELQQLTEAANRADNDTLRTHAADGRRLISKSNESARNGFHASSSRQWEMAWNALALAQLECQRTGAAVTVRVTPLPSPTG